MGEFGCCVSKTCDTFETCLEIKVKGSQLSTDWRVIEQATGPNAVQRALRSLQ